MSSQIGNPNNTPLISTGPESDPEENILCSSKTPVFGRLCLSLTDIIFPLSNTKTEFFKRPLSLLGAPITIAAFPSPVRLASWFISFSTRSRKSFLSTRSSIG